MKLLRWALILVSIGMCLSFGCSSLPKIGQKPEVKRGEQPVTFVQLLDQMTDLDRLAEHPGDLYQIMQASSYDRRSTDPQVANESNWLANRDFVSPNDLGNFLRIEEKNGEKEYVLMETDGPGAIVRIWSAVAEHAGTIRIYLDHNSEPVIDMSFAELLGGRGTKRRLIGVHEPVSAKPCDPTNDKCMQFPAPICGQRAMGWNSFLPIPYATHCKVVTTKADETYWYQVTYRKYRPDVKVESFNLDIAEANWDKIKATAKKLGDPADEIRPLNDPHFEWRKHKKQDMLQPGQSFAMTVDGRQQAIYRFQCHLDSKMKPAEMEKVLRGCLLKIWFDDREPPMVEAPLGDFFATAPGLNPLESLPLTVMGNGTLICNWVMPFQNDMRLQIANHSGRPVELAAELWSADRVWTENTMYFYARWRQDLYTNSMPRRDWNYIDINGKGVCLGNMLHIANSNRDWWGEGDEKIWIDGENFPRIFGTGTEDYYSYACCSNILFSHPYHNQPRCDGPGNSGHTCLSRFHIMDDIAFNDSLKFDMEIWHWDRAQISLAATSWYYAQPHATDNRMGIKPSQLCVPMLPPADERTGRNLFPEK